MLLILQIIYYNISRYYRGDIVDICDNCKKEFRNVYWKLICDENGNEKELWLCAGCWNLPLEKLKKLKPTE